MNNTVIKSIEILKLIADHPEGMTLAQIVKALTLPKSTAYNIVRTLVEQEMLRDWGEKQPLYRLGLGALKIGLSYLSGTTLDAAARPVLSRLCSETGETVFMSVRRGKTDLVYIMKYHAETEYQTVCSIGSVRSFLTVAMGKAMLATMEDAEIAEIVTQEMFAGCSIPSVRDTASLLAFVEQVRRQGYVMETTGENPQFASAVAAPVLDVNHQLAGAISILMMRDPYNSERAVQLGARVNEAALEISKGLGYLQESLFE